LLKKHEVKLTYDLLFNFLLRVFFKYVLIYFRYKQVLANGRECQEKIFIVKSGEMLVWIKINKNHIKNYKKKLYKYHVKEKLPQSDSNQHFDLN